MSAEWTPEKKNTSQLPPWVISKYIFEQDSARLKEMEGTFKKKGAHKDCEWELLIMS